MPTASRAGWQLQAAQGRGWGSPVTPQDKDWLLLPCFSTQPVPAEATRHKTCFFLRMDIRGEAVMTLTLSGTLQVLVYLTLGYRWEDYSHFTDKQVEVEAYATFLGLRRKWLSQM